NNNNKKMHLVVTNIPESFRTPDLRNFFSEYVEKGAFQCFHFRHRPQTHLAGLLDNNATSSPQQHISRSQTNAEKVSSKEDSNKTLCPHSPDATSLKVQQELIQDTDNTLNKRLRKSTSVEYNQDDKPVHIEYNNEEKNSSASKVHWLNSGLSGLSSLINEKKEKAKTDLKHSMQLLHREGTSSTCSMKSDIDKSMKKQSGSDNLHSSVSLHVIDMMKEAEAKRTCCILNIKEDFVEKFTLKYDKKHWVDLAGEVLVPRCYILKINFRKSKTYDDSDYKTRKELDSQSLSVESPLDLVEFCPPTLMPQGNVGTPTQHFKNLIKACQLPGIIIRKLGLEFPRSRGQKRFSQVPFNYGTSVVKTKPVLTDESGIAFTAAGHLIPSSADFTRVKKKLKKKRICRRPKLELEVEKEDGAETEEWERYEAFHNDVTSQDRIKERLFEKEIELVWEKGGPGLVFYTDAQYWREQEGDFDEQTTDEWDVDMSVYYEEGAGDRDAQDSVAMLHSDKLRSGNISHSVFKTPRTHDDGKKKMSKNTSSANLKKRIGPTSPPVIGEFEEHTRGFGRRLLEAQGWHDGQGLGKDAKGLPYALDGDGQHPHDKKGFGYYGEKLHGWRTASSTGQQHQSRLPGACKKHQKDVLISTVFDCPSTVDPPAPTLRTREPTTLSHRHNYVAFARASDSS
ncbi:hypothetical protein OTU49_006729, partial [Cherax quadricarinatus]